VSRHPVPAERVEELARAIHELAAKDANEKVGCLVEVGYDQPDVVDPARTEARGGMRAVGIAGRDVDGP